MISRSVPQTPSATVRTRIVPSDNGGSPISSSLAELAVPGWTVIARIASSNALVESVAAHFPYRALCHEAAKSSQYWGNEGDGIGVNALTAQKGPTVMNLIGRKRW